MSLRRLTDCDVCGAVVRRPDAHADWHEKNRAALAAALVQPRKPAAIKVAKAAKPVPRKGGK